MDLHSAPKGSISLSSETGLRSRERLNNQVWRLNNQGSPTWGWAHRQRAGRCVVVCLSAAVGLLGSRDSLDRVTAWMLFTQRERTFTSPGPWPPNVHGLYFGEFGFDHFAPVSCVLFAHALRRNYHISFENVQTRSCRFLQASR